MAYVGLSQHIDFLSLKNPTDRFELQHLIGEGTYGEVYSAHDKTTGKKVAVKILESITDNLEEIEEEFMVLSDLSNHPNLPEFHGIFLKKGKTAEEDQLWFVMSLCHGGSITDLVHELKQNNSRLNDNQIAFVLRETLKALVFLHKNHCMHRDIKGHNILLTDEGSVKLVDFGVSSHLARTLARRNTSVGTPFWMSPEVIACEQQLDQSYDSRCDVWSLGITAIEIAEGDPPLCDLHPMRALFQIPRNPAPRLVHPSNFSPQLNDFISECLVKDFELRPFSKELLDHPLMKMVDETKARRDLKLEIERQRKNGRGAGRRADATTKYGKLKTDRKQKPEKIDDLAGLEVLTEETIVEQLRKRYESNQIYTNIGDILISINPFENLGLYTPTHQKKYNGRCQSENPPHIFAIADSAHQNLVHQKQNQAIVISGESGSGKTESANLLLKQLVFLGKAPNRNLEEQILQVNPIMESFGNASTGINANSSRFGKYLELMMTGSGKVTGARISVYLLEQSRVVNQGDNEGNFHVFYYLYDGLEAENRLQDYYLDRDYKKRHKYLNLKHVNVSTKVNEERWKQLKSSFKVLGFKEEQVDSIQRVLAGILNLGDIDFAESDDNDNEAHVIDLAPIHRVAKLLGVDSNDLCEALTSTSVVTRGETITRRNSVETSQQIRDSMSKALYSRLFDHIVNHINQLLVYNRPNSPEQLSVGLLDIFGFENFARNNFEQLMINIANEQIQYYFNQHIFTWEQQEYMAEGIPVDMIEFADNRPVLDMLLSRPLGLLALLDEESRFPRSSDKTLTDKFHANVKSKFYQRPKSDANCFAVHHYAGRVVYDCNGFLEKNKNFLPAEVIQLLRQSSYDMIRFLFQCPITKTGNLYSALSEPVGKSTVPNNIIKIDTKERFNSRGLASQSRVQQTVATYFRFSLMELLQRMVSGNPWFIRCIKPNDIKASKNYDTAKVVKQLRYTGVMETIKIRQNGYSHRIVFGDFLKRYCFLGFGFNERVVANRESCRLLLMRLKMEGWALGKSKVFLKYFHIEQLSKLYEERVRKIVVAQSCVRRWLAMRIFKKLKMEKELSALTLQKHVRGWLTRRKIKLMQERNIREKIEKEKKNNENKMMHFMSRSALLKKLDSDEEKSYQQEKENRAASVIQSCFRGYTLRRKQKFTPEMEAKVKIILNTAENRHEAMKLLQRENFHHEDIVRIVQKFYRRESPSQNGSEMSSHDSREREYTSFSYSPSKKLSPRDQQAELVNFAQNVHMLNQEMHRNLRQNKKGIPISRIENLPADYKRPPGFSIVPNLLGSKHHALSQTKKNGKIDSIDNEELQSPLSDFDNDESPWAWDLPYYKKKTKTELNRLHEHIHKEQIVVQNGDRNDSHANWYNKLLANPHADKRGLIRPQQQNDYYRNIAAFNYLQPNFKQIPQKIISNPYDVSVISDLHEKQLKKQQQFVSDKKEKEKEKKSKKSKKSNKGSPIHGDSVLVKPQNVAPPRNNVPKHDYQNLDDEKRKLDNKKKSASPAKSQDKKIICGIKNGVYYFNSSNSSSLTSFAELKNDHHHSSDAFNGDVRMKNFSLSKYLNIDMKSVSPDSSGSGSSKSEKSSTISDKSVESIEQAIIRNGLKKGPDDQNSYLGPFNFRKLLKPTGQCPTESLRKRKGKSQSSPPPDKSIRTKA